MLPPRFLGRFHAETTAAIHGGTQRAGSLDEATGGPVDVAWIGGRGSRTEGSHARTEARTCLATVQRPTARRHPKASQTSPRCEPGGSMIHPGDLLDRRPLVRPVVACTRGRDVVAPERRLYVCLAIALFGPGMVTLLDLPDEPTAPWAEERLELHGRKGTEKASFLKQRVEESWVALRRAQGRLGLE